MAATDPYPVKAEVTMDTNVFGTNMVCEKLFPVLKDGARYVLYLYLLSLSLTSYKSFDVMYKSNQKGKLASLGVSNAPVF